jgi:hypothetical protein
LGGIFGLIDGAELNLNGSMSGERFFSLLVAFAIKIQCFGNLAL